MSPWLAFFLGIFAGSVAICLSVGVLLSVASSTPRMACASLAGLLRGFARNVDDLSIVLEVDGQNLFVPFERLATAIENAEVAHIVGDPPATPTASSSLS